MSKTIRKLAPIVVGLLLAALLIGVGGLSFNRKVSSFRTLGFDAKLFETGWQVTAAEAGSPLLPGDRIYLVNGSTPSDLDELRRDLHSRPTNALLIERNGIPGELELPRPPLRIDFSYLILALIGALYLLIGLYTLLRNRQRPGILFYAWCFVSAIFFLLSPVGVYDAFDRLIYGLDQFARVLLPPLTVHFFLSFPGNVRRARLWVSFVYLPAAVLLTLHADTIFASGRILVGGSEAGLGRAIWLLQRADQYHVILFSLLAAGILGYRMLHEERWQERRQVQWVALGMAVGYLPFLGFLLLQQISAPRASRGPLWMEALAVLPLALVPLAFAGSILRYKLWDIDVVVRDTISYTVTALLAVVGFSLVNLGVSRGLPAELGLARNLVSFSAGLMIAAMVSPVRRQVSSSLERFQYRGAFLRRRALKELAGRLLQERDLERLCHELLDNLEDALGLEKANLYLSHGDYLVPAHQEGTLPSKLSFEAFEEDLWQRDVASVSSFSLPLSDETEAQRVFLSGYRYAFPLMVRGNRVGVALTSYRHGNRPLSSEDQDLIRSLLNQASLAIENAQLLSQLQQQLGEVQRLKSYSDGIIESSPAATAVLDVDDHVLSANLAFSSLVNRPPKAVLGRPLIELLPVSPLPEPDHRGPMEVSYCELDGTERYLSLSIARFQLSSRRDLRVLVVHDLSERMAMEQALQRQDRLAALGMLAAGVAHEVNTPITGISSYAQMLLADTPEDDPRHGILRKVEAQTFRAARIVNNLLEFARNRRGEYRTVSLNSVLTDSLDLLKERFTKSGLRVTWEPPEETFAVEGSEGELQQVFTNLLLNARDALAAAGGEVTVRLGGCSSKVQVVIEDTGPGIPQERLETIFQPFFSTKLSQGGTGLGLSISYDIVRRHQGDMSVWSRQGVGTRFTIELPRVLPSPQQTA
ncbi:MAG: GAF domain-containing protein [Acidobacteria bacterium]|nr:GAF domain-containing protein [Acidobacteriota bacterium]